MTRTVWLILVITINAIVATVSPAQTNSYSSATNGFWDEARLWSLATPPSVTQSGIFITNAASVNVTIDSITANSFPDTLTISNLNIYPTSDNSSALYLDNTGTVALHILDGLDIGSNPNGPNGGATLICSNSALIVDGLLGGQLEDDGTLVFSGGSLIMTNCSLEIANGFESPYLGLLILSNATVRAGGLTIATMENSSGTVEMSGGLMTLSSLNVGDGEELSEGSLFIANGALVVVTNGETEIGGFFEGSGILTVSNASFLAKDIFLGGTRCGGQLAINNGTVTVNGKLDIGTGEQGSGGVSLDGGALVVTNGVTNIGFGEPSAGNYLTINGLFLARDIYVGAFESEANLIINGGTSILSSNLQIGQVNSEAFVSIAGGQLFVTNAPMVLDDGGSCDVSGGQLVAQTIVAGVFAAGSLSVNSGSVSVSTGITLGDCNETFAFGAASVNGGQLIVTNASRNGYINVQNGQLSLSGGTVQVDQLVMTNTCSSLVHTGGTLIVGSVILDPNAFRIVSVTRQSNDVLVSWLMAPGATNALQASNGTINGSYTTNNFTDIFIVTNNTATGVLTNFLDHGAATNKSRFYRARLSL